MTCSIPLGRNAQVEEVARAVVLLASKKAKFAGQPLLVNWVRIW
jgi:NAD(P)-dependent dehydrogenase (short-subunit alcohol dehydrogenase family)